jgi:hypothetical protein
MADSLSNSPKTNNANVNQNNTQPGQNVQQNNNQSAPPQGGHQNSEKPIIPRQNPVKDSLNVKSQTPPGAMNNGAIKDSAGTKTEPKDSANVNSAPKKKNSRVRDDR